jgi:TonB family protein
VNKDHSRIEALAGAIALGEASDEDRRRYREHIAVCAACLHSLGGEREIERVARTVSDARESEVWEPALGDVVRTGLNRKAKTARHAFSIVAACLLVALGVRLAEVNGALHFLTPSTGPVASTADAMRIVLETRRPPAAQNAAPLPVPQRRLMVVHNVVQIARAPLAAPPVIPAPAPKRQSAPAQIATITVHPDVAPTQNPTAVKSDVPIWRRDDPSWRTVARTTTTSFSETAPQSFAEHAESIRMMHPQVIRDAAPVGGETAISPQPPIIAYDEGAEGTTVFEVLIDEQGNPTKCVITRPSGYEVLDDSVCKAAMHAKYTPKTIDGRAVAGIYHDAFTFRMTSDDEDVSHPIH